MLIRAITDGDEDRVVDLWEACGLTRPGKAPRDYIALARKSPQAEIFVGILDDEIVASALCGSDGHRGWVYYLAVTPKHQKDGLGAKMMAHGEIWLRDMGVSKVELMIRPENKAVREVYERIEYAVEDRIVMSR